MLEPAHTVEIFQRQPDLRTLKPGEAIYHEGDAADYMYGIIEGEVEMVKQGKVYETLKAGQVFGIGGILGVGPRQSDAIAKTDCKLAYLEQKHFLFAVQETPMFAVEVMRNYSIRLRRLMDASCEGE
ncbi:cyclic nucleotide-binding domain-containing protein [Leptodesmis sichuanensis]|uniref:cyclic nucleotide-binding domain-containing protein n=1 Tax=Leptodesmis sichuanensis TaxID=2906798 RepID=UPI001F170EB2|nr:Crp/Fnr family transcriptional regulator [Leptodesmis sichuanensis]UIE40021.1 Crp/Fnr family transcriptional regulator [Leptodesmis sichuanensis A121]